MRVTTVFNKLLAVQGVFVRKVLLGALGIVVEVVKRQRRHRCPRCTFSTRARYDQTTREWRHVSLGKWRVVIRAVLCRLVCPEHGVVTEVVPWAEHDSRFTRGFEDLVAWVAREMNKTAVTSLLHIAWATVGNIIERVVKRKLDPSRLEQLYRIGIDEVSYRKGHKYLTVVANHETGDPVWIGEGRSQATLGAFFDEIGEEGTKGLNAISMDMCAPYILEAKERAPKAEIAFDPFHVVKLGNEAVQEVRRSEARERKGSATRSASSSAAPMASIRSKLSPPWSSSAAPTSSSNYPFDVEESQMIDRHWNGIAAYCKPENKVALGFVEGFNNKVRVIQRRAYGLRDEEYLRLKILTCMLLPI